MITLKCSHFLEMNNVTVTQKGVNLESMGVCEENCREKGGNGSILLGPKNR